MRKLVYIIIFLMLISSIAFAEREFFYRTYDEKTGEAVNTFSITVEDMQEGERIVYWKKKEGKYLTIEEYILDAEYATKSWKVKRPSDQTFYVGQRKGNVLILNGKLKGKPLNKQIKIDEKPFYYNPKLGLRKFVLSRKPSAQFWALRNDDVTEYLMEAQNKGPETIKISGQNIEAIRVHWTLPDFRSAFFKRVYWFRESDGYYIRQKASKNQIRELVKEAK